MINIGSRGESDSNWLSIEKEGGSSLCDWFSPLDRLPSVFDGFYSQNDSRNGRVTASFTDGGKTGEVERSGRGYEVSVATESEEGNETPGLRTKGLGGLDWSPNTYISLRIK